MQKVINKENIGFPFWLLIFYLVFEYIRPQNIFTFLYPLKIPLLTALILMFFYFLKGDKTAINDRLIKLNLVFIFLTLSGLIYAVNHYWVVEHTKMLVLYLFAVALPMITLINSEKKILLFFKIWVFIQIVVVVLTIVRGGTGVSSFLTDENDLALSLVVSMPIAYYLSQSKSIGKSTRLIFMIATVGFILAIINTQSRGGFLGLVVAMAVILLFSKNKIKNFFIVFVLALISLSFIPESYYSEIESISDTQDSTRMDRFYLWGLATDMYLDNPVFGVGAGNYAYRLPEYQLKDEDYNPNVMPLRGGTVSHSLYFTILAEYGTTGIAVFVVMVIIIYKRLKNMMAKLESLDITEGYPNDLMLLIMAMVASLAGFLTSSSFIVVTVYPHFWYMLAMVIILEESTKQTLIKYGKSE